MCNILTPLLELQALWHSWTPCTFWDCSWLPRLVVSVWRALPEVLTCEEQHIKQWFGFGSRKRLHGGGTKIVRESRALKTKAKANWESSAEVIGGYMQGRPYGKLHRYSLLKKTDGFALFRYVFGYQKYSGLQAKGLRPMGTKITHIVSSTMMASLLQSLMRDKLCPKSCGEELEIQVQ